MSNKPKYKVEKKMLDRYILMEEYKTFIKNGGNTKEFKVKIQKLEDRLYNNFREHNINYLLLSYIISELQYLFQNEIYHWEDRMFQAVDFQGANALLEIIDRFNTHPYNIEELRVVTRNKNDLLTKQKVHQYFQGEDVTLAKKYTSETIVIAGLKNMLIMFKAIQQSAQAFEIYAHSEKKLHKFKISDYNDAGVFHARNMQYCAYITNNFIQDQKINFENETHQYRLVGKILASEKLIPTYKKAKLKSKKKTKPFYRNKPEYYYSQYTSRLIQAYQKNCEQN